MSSSIRVRVHKKIGINCDGMFHFESIVFEKKNDMDGSKEKQSGIGPTDVYNSKDETGPCSLKPLDEGFPRGGINDEWKQSEFGCVPRSLSLSVGPSAPH